MMLDYHILDVFTETAYAGNPLAVVLGAEGLSDARMQAMAREFNLAETFFVLPPRDPAHAAAARIFTPEAEIPFAGHPTIGAAILLAERAQGPGDFATTLILEEVAGLVPVRVWRQGGVTRAELTAPVLPAPQGGPLDPAALAPLIGLDPADLAGPVQVWAGGPAFVFARVAELGALARARRPAPGWADRLGAPGIVGLYLYTDGNGTDLQARMFAPEAGVPEDPATGSATAILAGPLHAARPLPAGETVLTILQGAEMGRPSHLTLTVRIADGQVAEARVAGGAVRVAEGRIAPPGQRLAGPKGYWVAHGTVTDPDAYAAYRAANARAFARHGARFLIRGGPQEVVEGAARPRTVVLEFPSPAAARACWDDPEYQSARALRLPVSTTDLVLVEGWEG
jgi:trans-2,3-dihydro-3-hydroxyanthranilate isomerase